MPTDTRAEYDALVADVTASSSVITDQIFGMPCLKDNGKAFAGYYQGAMVFKLAEPSRAEALRLPGAHLFDPSSHGRPMKEWAVVPAEHRAKWLDFAREALNYVARGKAGS